MRHRFSVTNWLTAAYRVVQLVTRRATHVGAGLPLATYLENIDPYFCYSTPAFFWYYLGTEVVRKTALPSGMGYWAHMSDTEGNIVGLHAMN